MTQSPHLNDLLTVSRQAFPDQTALEDPGRGQLTYRELESCVNELAAILASMGVRSGDRVGMYMHKSLASVIAIFAILKNNAAYVPVDAAAPPDRNSFIFTDCGVQVLIVETSQLDAFLQVWVARREADIRPLDMFDRFGLNLKIVFLPTRTEPEQIVPGLAYILYTSGSTGVPKGVIHTHDSAFGFIDWCAEEFSLSETDRFSSHAPFHFDLSIFDVFVSIKSGATLVLINETAGKQPVALAELIEDRGITVWYSTPSILRMLVEFGRLGGKNFGRLKLVLFAGETYPLNQFHQLNRHWDRPVFYNLYGPTETNVCTYYRLPDTIHDDAYDYFPIGLACSGDRLKIIDQHDCEVERGIAGELVVRGDSVMVGYWNLPERNHEAYTQIGSQRWYRTGDIVEEMSDGNIHYLSRRDRMVKRRGYRVELGEIEAALYRFDKVVEVAAVADRDNEGDVKITVFLTTRGEKAPSIIELKTFSAVNLLPYMIPDKFVVLDGLPKTSTDKIDHQKLKEM